MTGGTGISVSNSSGKVTISHTRSVTAGTVSGTSGSVDFGGTISIPKIAYDAQGHITGATTATVTLPSAPSDEKVKQSTYSTSEYRPILGAYSASPTSGTNGQAYYNSNIAINTTTNSIKVSSCVMTYDATEECMKFTFS